MKTTMKFAVVVILIAMSVSTSFASKNPSLMKRNYELIEANLLNGITTENEGLKTSSAYYLGELKSRKAVLPLMKILHDGKSDSERISAALALIKIGESRGVFAVKQASKFDSSEKVRNTCRLFYADYMKSKQSME